MPRPPQTARYRSALLLVIAPLSLVACGDSDPVTTTLPGDAPVTVAFRAEESSAVTPQVLAAGDARASLADAPSLRVVPLVTANGDTIYIDSVQVALGNVRLRRAGVAACVDSVRAASGGVAAEASGCVRLDLGPMVINLPLQPTDAAPIQAIMPAGSYRGMLLDIRRVRTGAFATARDSALLASNPEMANASVRVVGRYLGQPFELLGRRNGRIAFGFDPALVIGSAVQDNVTIVINPGRWFRAADGNILAPTAGNRSVIEDRMFRSFRAFGDRQRSGRSDSASRPGSDGAPEIEPDSAQ